jgi:dephospho-CoA kinase
MPPTPRPARRAASGRPLLVGLTGSIGAGKSAALAAFARHGAAVLSSDAVVHELYRTPEVRDAVVARLGADVLGPAGEIDRSRVAARVFGDSALVAWLEGLLHPRVAAALGHWRDGAHDHVPAPLLLVHEVPLLFEAGLESRYDRTLVVTAPDGVRHARLAARGGLPALAERESRLLPQEEKRLRANDEIVNDGDLDALDRAVAAYVDRHAAAR